VFLEQRRGQLRETVGERSREIEEYIDVDALRRAYRRYADEASMIDGERVWKAACLAAWLRRQRIVQVDPGLAEPPPIGKTGRVEGVSSHGN
jgi:hypothetical protein